MLARFKDGARSGAVIIAALLLAGQAWATVGIGADNAHLQYTGRVDQRNAAAPEISWPGTSIEGNFTGATLAIKLDDQFGKNFFDVYIDGDLARPVLCLLYTSPSPRDS